MPSGFYKRTIKHKKILKDSHKYMLGDGNLAKKSEIRKKISQSLKGNKNCLGRKLTEEHRNKLRKSTKKSWERGVMRSGMKGKHHNEKTKQKISDAKKGKYTGEKASNWKGGITPEHTIIRHSLEHKIWAKEVYERDYWTCRLCKKKCKKDIIAHHIQLFADFPELRFSVDNGITLCRSCHKRVHQDIGLKTRFKA